jgi:hypothetical protein
MVPGPYTQPLPSSFACCAVDETRQHPIRGFFPKQKANKDGAQNAFNSRLDKRNNVRVEQVRGRLQSTRSIALSPSPISHAKGMAGRGRIQSTLSIMPSPSPIRSRANGMAAGRGRIQSTLSIMPSPLPLPLPIKHANGMAGKGRQSSRSITPSPISHPNGMAWRGKNTKYSIAVAVANQLCKWNGWEGQEYKLLDQ